MRTTYAPSGARRVGASLLLALVLLCLPGISVVGGSEANAAESASPQLVIGTGYGQTDGSGKVRTLQRRLRVLGQDPGPIDGLYGPLTRAAVERFQRNAAVSVDGIVGQQTRKALRAASPLAFARGEGFGEPGGSDQVRSVQRGLRRLNQDPGRIDGLYGPRTEAAVAGFQRDEGLTASGQVDRRTLRAIADAQPGRETRERPAGRKSPSPDQQPQPSNPPSNPPDGRSPAPATPAVQAGDSEDSGSGPDLLPVLALLTLALIAVGTARAVRRSRPATGGAAVNASNGIDTGPSPLAYWQEPKPKPKPAPETMKPGAPQPSWIEANGKATSRPSTPAPREGAPAAAWVPAPPQEDTMRALGYVSFATPEESSGSENTHQLEALDRYCEQRGWELAEVVHDVRSPGRRVSSPGLDYALERVAAGDASCLLVAELRRLGNSAGELGRILQTLRERDVHLVAVDTALDTKSAEGQLAVDALIAVGEMEHDRDAEVARNGLDAARARGSSSGRPTVHDVPALKKHIQAMRSSGMTLKAIAERLNAEGVPTLRGGSEWRPSSVQVAAGYRRPPQPGRAGATFDTVTSWPRKRGS
jgi:peptidoglycan hydrolase-like protein with peptidoglycan-binding domain/DNA invertase Pin-like site-specific DNA recombinase